MPEHPVQRRWREYHIKSTWATLLQKQAKESKARLHAMNAVCREAANGTITPDQAVVKVHALAEPVAPRRAAPVIPRPPAPVVRRAPVVVVQRQQSAAARLETFVADVVTKHLAQATPAVPAPTPADLTAVIEKILTAILPQIAATVAAATKPPAKGRTIRTIQRDSAGRISAVVEGPAD